MKKTYHTLIVGIISVAAGLLMSMAAYASPSLSFDSPELDVAAHSYASIELLLIEIDKVTPANSDEVASATAPDIPASINTQNAANTAMLSSVNTEGLQLFKSYLVPWRSPSG